MTEVRSQQDFDLLDTERSGGHPLIATLICAALLLLSAVAGSGQNGPEMGQGLAYLVGYLIAGGFVGGLLWGIAYAITIKRASVGWRVATLIVLIVIGLLSSLVKIGARAIEREADARDAAHQLRQITEADKLPGHIAGGSGPLSRMSAAYLNRLLDDQRALERDLTEIGFAQVVSLEGLTRVSPVLRRCGDFAPLAARARHLGAEGLRANLAAARQIGDAAVLAGELSARDEADFFEGAEQSRPSYERQWALNAQIVEEAQAVCATLASRPWVLSREQILFTRPGDAEAVNGHLRRIRSDNAEQERMRDDFRARSREQINAIER